MSGPRVTVRSVPARQIAAVRRTVALRDIPTTWRPALDQVWEFLRAHPGLRTDGPNVFVYHHPTDFQSPTDIDFGVEVARPFEPSGDVRRIETPAGRVARAVHVGGYEHLGATHAAIHAWARAHHVAFAGTSWEVYGDWTPDPAKLRTEVQYLVR